MLPSFFLARMLMVLLPLKFPGFSGSCMFVGPSLHEKLLVQIVHVSLIPGDQTNVNSENKPVFNHQKFPRNSC